MMKPETHIESYRMVCVHLVGLLGDRLDRAEMSEWRSSNRCCLPLSLGKTMHQWKSQGYNLPTTHLPLLI